MQRLFAVDIDLPVGSSVRSALLNHSGHYVAVVDIHRLSDSRYPYWLFCFFRFSEFSGFFKESINQTEVCG